MIAGRVLGGNLYPLVDLEIRDHDGAVNLVTFIVDTGNDFSLVMTPDLIARLGSQELPGTTEITFATGDRRSARYYRAEVMWDGEFKPVRVIEGVAPLMGRKLICSYFPLNRDAARWASLHISSRIPVTTKLTHLQHPSHHYSTP